ncbi:MAG: hypothetical protein EAZ92_13800 [Candidatus Kapaibacterium sp.]|nr:MAG: hypothetical protein EAZ92_13800 [Candidatus Kapabacteria bacterium]
MKNLPLPRLDEPSDLRDRLMPYCRLSLSEVWTGGVHRVGCVDAANLSNSGVLKNLHRGKEFFRVKIRRKPYI